MKWDLEIDGAEGDLEIGGVDWTLYRSCFHIDKATHAANTTCMKTNGSVMSFFTNSVCCTKSSILGKLEASKSIQESVSITPFLCVIRHMLFPYFAGL